MPASKPKNSKAKRFLENRAPKFVENVKKSLFLRGTSTSDVVIQALQDLHCIKKPESLLFTRKCEQRPFEDDTSLEFLCQKNDCSLFGFGSHNKKRPHNLILGRMYNGHVLDMIELGIKNLKSLRSIKGPKHTIGSKPMFVFQGDQWEHNETFAKLRSLLLDMFVGKTDTMVNLAGLDHVIVVSVVKETVYFRHYAVVFKKSGGPLPRVELEEMGPHMDLEIRRTRFAAADLVRDTLRVPKETGEKKVKNFSRNSLGDKVGRVHMHKQDFDNLQLRKVKALKKRKETPEDGSAKKAKKSKVSDGGDN